MVFQQGKGKIASIILRESDCSSTLAARWGWHYWHFPEAPVGPLSHHSCFLCCLPVFSTAHSNLPFITEQGI